MKEPKSKRIYAGLLILLMSAVAIGAAARPNFDRENMHERMFERMSSKLELSADQTQQLEQLREQFQQEHDALREQIKEKRSAIKLQSNTEVFDESAIEALAEDLGSLQAQATVAKARHRHQFQQLLTDEQRSKMAEWKSKHGKHKGRHGKKRFERMHEDAHALDN